MNEQVFTIATSASASSSAIVQPPSASCPSMTSESTWFFAQPSVRKKTRGAAGAAVIGAGG